MKKHVAQNKRKKKYLSQKPMGVVVSQSMLGGKISRNRNELTLQKVQRKIPTNNNNNYYLTKSTATPNEKNRIRWAKVMHTNEMSDYFHVTEQKMQHNSAESMRKSRDLMESVRGNARIKRNQLKSEHSRKTKLTNDLSKRTNQQNMENVHIHYPQIHASYDEHFGEDDKKNVSSQLDIDRFLLLQNQYSNNNYSNQEYPNYMLSSHFNQDLSNDTMNLLTQVLNPSSSTSKTVNSSTSESDQKSNNKLHLLNKQTTTMDTDEIEEFRHYAGLHQLSDLYVYKMLQNNAKQDKTKKKSRFNIYKNPFQSKYWYLCIIPLIVWCLLVILWILSGLQLM
ncbi:unnamed protein product [Schistosoma turkestanicum]|nr:unnamed protein product [Schistosoma turkestanicum]